MRYYITLFITLISLLFCSSGVLAKEGDFTIVIDAGHGGHDTGAMDNGAREKDINLGVALALGNMIKKNLPDVKVVYTRSDDTFKTLQQRADIANNAKGNLFVSIHTNSVDKKSANRSSVAGASVYTLGLHKDDNNMSVARRENSVIELESDRESYQGFDPNKDESYIIFEMAQKKNLSKSIRFASDVQKQLVAVADRKDRGVHQAGFWVLWATSMPSVLVELDFICNPTSTRFMTSSEGQNLLAQSIFNAVKDYVKREQASTPAKKGSSVKAGDSGKDKPSKEKTGKKKSRSKKNKKQAQAEPEPAAAPTDNASGLPTLATVKKEEEKRHTYRAPDRRSGGVGSRRRRGNAAREASNRNIQEVASIPLSRENDYVTVASVKEETPQPAADPQKKDGKKKSKKKSKKSASSKVQHLRKSYAILVVTSDKQLGVSDSQFMGLTPLSSFKENNKYKYVYGDFSSRSDAEKELKKIKGNFPKAAVIQQYKNQ